MFTLGNKEAIVNGSGQYTSTAVGPGTSLAIKSFGTFGAASAASEIMAQTYVAATLGAGVLTVPSAATLGITAGTVRNPVNFLLRVNTSRHSSEWANDFIKRGRPYVFQVSVDGGEAATSIATKLVAVFAEYEAKFKTTDNAMGSLPFDWSVNGADIAFQLKAGELSFQATTVFQIEDDTWGYNVLMAAEATGLFDTGLTGDAQAGTSAGTPIGISASPLGILEVGQTIVITDDTSAKTGQITALVDNGASSTMTLNVDVEAEAGTSTIEWSIGTALGGEEARVDGKYLEENVTMSTQYTDGAYVTKAGERPVVGASYVMLSWKYSAPTQGTGSWAGHDRLGTAEVDMVPSSKLMKFSMYFNADVFLTAIQDAGAATDGTGVVAGSDCATVLSWLNANTTDADWANGTAQDWS